MTHVDPNAGLELDWLQGEDDWAAGMNLNLRILRARMQGTVVNRQDAPPGSPADGDFYVVGTSPTGAWSANANDLAYWEPSAWRFTTPQRGERVYNVASATWIQWNGTKWLAANSVPENIVAAGIAGAVTLDLDLGRNFLSDPVGNNVTLSFDNEPTVGYLEVYYRFIQDATGGRTLTFPAGMLWPGGTAPVAAAGSLAISDFKFRRVNSLAWLGEEIGLNYS